MRRVIGIDPSLTGTALALPDDTTVRIEPKTRRGCQRLAYIRDAVMDYVDLHLDGDPEDLVVIESYSFASKNSQAHAQGELGGVLRLSLWEQKIRFVEVAPTARAKWATGKGNSAKDAVVSAVSASLGRSFPTNDEVDAYLLRDVGVALGGGESAFGPLPKYRQEVLDKIRKEQ